MEFLENADAPENLLRLVATLARPYSKPNFKATGDARNPLSTDPKIAEHGIELRANFFKDLDVAVVMATLRYFEGVKKEVYEMGVASGIFPKPKETKEGEEPTKSEKDALFGWWTAYRNVAKSQNKTEEEVWQMSLWRVLSVMIEEKIKADEAEKQLRQTGKNE